MEQRPRKSCVCLHIFDVSNIRNVLKEGLEIKCNVELNNKKPQRIFVKQLTKEEHSIELSFRFRKMTPTLRI